MAWIEIIPYADADDRLKAQYDRLGGAGAVVDNVIAVHSLRPHTMAGHMALYREVLHSTHNSVPKWFLEALGVWVSVLNGCHYCEAHHFRGMKRLLRDDARAAALCAAFRAGDLAAAPVTAAERTALGYARTLTRDPAALGEADAAALRAVGWSDGEILEINQVCAYFAYANRTVLGLGCALEQGVGQD
jgi:uncharacterized peroxidase-related enzyme